MEDDKRYGDSKAGDPDYTQPVAYDASGQPLYHHPPEDLEDDQVPNQEQNSVVDLDRLHRESTVKYPHVTLHSDEYIVMNVERHIIGLISIWAGQIVAIAAILGIWVYLLVRRDVLDAIITTPSAQFAAFLASLILCLLVFVLGWIGAMIYRDNRFFITNQRVIKYVRMGIFSRQRRTVILDRIEDVNYRQSGIFQMLLNYGSIRLTTVGDETTYPFSIVKNPRVQTRIINEVIIAYKNEQPISTHIVEELS